MSNERPESETFNDLNNEEKLEALEERKEKISASFTDEELENEETKKSVDNALSNVKKAIEDIHTNTQEKKTE